ncbi:hypothetical protein BCR36DRAFT_257933, partial [Piromyces finnis]
RCSFGILDDGYPCCSSVNPEVQYTDDNGNKWGVEDGEWCDEIKMNLNTCAKNDDEKFYNWDHNPTPSTVCFSEVLGYPCCSDPNADVVTTDEYGQWGIENNLWCGI